MEVYHAVKNPIRSHQSLFIVTELFYSEISSVTKRVTDCFKVRMFKKLHVVTKLIFQISRQSYCAVQWSLIIGIESHFSREYF